MPSKPSAPNRSRPSRTPSSARRAAIAQRTHRPASARRLLKVEEVARLLNVSRSLVYKLIASGDLPVVYIGHALRFEPEAVEGLKHRRRPIVDPEP
jgi:excisionase family DNA binding protein